MTFKDGVAYLQAGGGIVFDSVEEDEYVETINKLGANVRCLEAAEGMSRSLSRTILVDAELTLHIDLAYYAEEA
jgi:hypothetical protein